MGFILIFYVYLMKKNLYIHSRKQQKERRLDRDKEMEMTGKL